MINKNWSFAESLYSHIIYAINDNRTEQQKKDVQMEDKFKNMTKKQLMEVIQKYFNEYNECNDCILTGGNKPKEFYVQMAYNYYKACEYKKAGDFKTAWEWYYKDINI